MAAPIAGAGAASAAADAAGSFADDHEDPRLAMDNAVQQLECLADGSEAAAEQYKRLVALARGCRARGDWSGVDSLGELSPAELRLASVDFHAARAAEKALALGPDDRAGERGADPSAARARAVVVASAHLVDFLRLAARLGALHPPEIAKLCAAAEIAAEVAAGTGEGSAGAGAPGRESRVARATAAALDAAAAAASGCRPVALRLAEHLDSGGDTGDGDVAWGAEGARLSAASDMEAELAAADAADRVEAVRALRSSPEARRAAAITRHRRDRGLERRLALLRAQERRAEALASLGEDGVAGRGSDAVAGEGVVGDAARRERAVIELLLHTRQAVDSVVAMAEEGQMLGRMLARATGGPGGAGSDERVRRLTGEDERRGGPGLSVVHFGADHSTRQEHIKATVFGDPRGRATIPLEVFAAQEQAEAEERARRQAEGEARQVMRADQLAEAGLEDDMEKVDLATRADREWDAWKDAHPRGMGVTKRV
ncbi:hypothetical protein FNF29_06428 [Cafeteria roenbergensis]|uniref:TAP42-like protein n=1 Tax=Cafeteria roenbergensis TaxID=33653 RepID=A0A5A8C713_CAFRO|nr:hypothetical protein FNF29_06428 [Cafeteria roenbergensis]|eukprot:KAA0148803.1 hypothetical protein FNF29_06428 [Cafeteria roenbergensis]